MQNYNSLNVFSIWSIAILSFIFIRDLKVAAIISKLAAIIF